MTTATSLEQRTVEPIVLGNLALDGEAVRGDDGKYLLKNQHGWMDYLAGTGTRLPTLPEYFAFIHHLQKENHSASVGLLNDLQKSALCVGTQFGYHHNNNIVTHLGKEPCVIPCAFPEGNGYLSDLVKFDDWRNVVQAAFGHPDVDEVVKVLRKFNKRHPYLWTSLAESRKATPERAVWLGVLTVGFGLDCSSSPIGNFGRARRVRKKSSNDLISAQECDTSSHSLRRLDGCEAPRVENEESNNRSQKQHLIRQRTYEEILTIAKPLVAKPLWSQFTRIVPKTAPVTGDVLQRTADEQYMSLHSWEQFKKDMEK